MAAYAILAVQLEIETDLARTDYWELWLMGQGLRRKELRRQRQRRRKRLKQRLKEQIKAGGKKKTRDKPEAAQVS